GIAASYGGRDFVTVEGGQGAYLTFDVDRAGHAIVECIAAAGAHWGPPEDILAPPGKHEVRPGVPPPATIAGLQARAPAGIVEAAASGLAERFGTTRGTATDVPRVRVPEPPDDAIHGEFLVDSAAIELVRAGATVDDVFSDPAHVLLGIEPGELV